MRRSAVRPSLGAFIAFILLLSAPAFSKDVVVGVSWSELTEERGRIDEPAIRTAVERAGAKYISVDAHGAADKQIADVEGLQAAGANALIVVAVDAGALGPAIKKCTEAGVSVIAYLRPIEDTAVLYVGVDEVAAGRAMTQELMKLQTTGDYALLRGVKSDMAAARVASGVLEALKPAVDSAKIRVIVDVAAEGPGADDARKSLVQALKKTRNKIDAVVVGGDGGAAGAFEALKSQGLAGAVPLAGRDADPHAIARVATGLQAVAVWSDQRELGRIAAEAAIVMAGGRKPAEIRGAKAFESAPHHTKISAILQAPIAITRENLAATFARGRIRAEDVCPGLKPGAFAFCK